MWRPKHHGHGVKLGQPDFLVLDYLSNSFTLARSLAAENQQERQPTPPWGSLHIYPTPQHVVLPTVPFEGDRPLTLVLTHNDSQSCIRISEKALALRFSLN